MFYVIFWSVNRQSLGLDRGLGLGLGLGLALGLSFGIDLSIGLCLASTTSMHRGVENYLISGG